MNHRMYCVRSRRTCFFFYRKVSCWWSPIGRRIWMVVCWLLGEPLSHNKISTTAREHEMHNCLIETNWALMCVPLVGFLYILVEMMLLMLSMLLVGFLVNIGVLCANGKYCVRECECIWSTRLRCRQRSCFGFLSANAYRVKPFA